MLVISGIKQVPDTTQVQIDPVTNTLVREGIPFIMKPYDTHALEAGLRLKDRFGVGAVTLSMGQPNAEAILCKARATAIERLGENEEVALVICGKQTIDGDTARSDQASPAISATAS